MRALFVVLLVLLAAPSARADEALRARCLDLLSAYEEPAGAAEWKALGAGAPAELLAIAQDASLSHTRRANAIVALGYFPGETRGFLATLATAEGGESLFRRKAVYALANGYGDAALPELTVALAAPDQQLRAATARALTKLATPAAKDALRARLPVEDDRMVRELISASVGGK